MRAGSWGRSILETVRSYLTVTVTPITSEILVKRQLNKRKAHEELYIIQVFTTRVPLRNREIWTLLPILMGKQMVEETQEQTKWEILRP